MPFIKKFLLAYFGAIAGTILVSLALFAFILGAFGLFFFGTNPVSEFFLRWNPAIVVGIISRADIVKLFKTLA